MMMMTMIMMIVLIMTIKNIASIWQKGTHIQCPLLSAENENAHLKMPRREQKSPRWYVQKEGCMSKLGRGCPLYERAWRDLSECIHVSSGYLWTPARRANSLILSFPTPPSQYIRVSPRVSAQISVPAKKKLSKSPEQSLSVLYFHNFMHKRISRECIYQFCCITKNPPTP